MKRSILKRTSEDYKDIKIVLCICDVLIYNSEFMTKSLSTLYPYNTLKKLGVKIQTFYPYDDDYYFSNNIPNLLYNVQFENRRRDVYKS